jgi:hypothetical protein
MGSDILGIYTSIYHEHDDLHVRQTSLLLLYAMALWWTKQHLRQVSPSTLISPANHHNHLGLAQKACWWPQWQVDPIGLHSPLYQFKN